MDWKKYYKIEKYIKELKDNNKSFNLILGLDEKNDLDKNKLKKFIHLFNEDKELPVFFIDYNENKNEILKMYEGIRHFPVLIQYENKEINFIVRLN